MSSSTMVVVVILFLFSTIAAAPAADAPPPPLTCPAANAPPPPLTCPAADALASFTCPCPAAAVPPRFNSPAAEAVTGIVPITLEISKQQEIKQKTKEEKERKKEGMSSAAAAPPAPSRNVAFYWMVMQNGNVVSGGAKNWKTLTIHGAWPADASKQSIVNCRTGAPFVGGKTLIKNVRGMKKYWPSFTGNKDEDFWEHEGSCSGLDQIKYFEDTVIFVQNELSDIYAVFNADGMVPGKGYPLQKFNNTFFQHYRAYPMFVCAIPPAYPHMALKEIWVNVTADLTHFQNYSDPLAHDCPGWDTNVMVRLQ